MENICLVGACTDVNHDQMRTEKSIKIPWNGGSGETCGRWLVVNDFWASCYVSMCSRRYTGVLANINDN